MEDTCRVREVRSPALFVQFRVLFCAHTLLIVTRRTCWPETRARCDPLWKLWLRRFCWLCVDLGSWEQTPGLSDRLRCAEVVPQSPPAHLSGHRSHAEGRWIWTRAEGTCPSTRPASETEGFPKQASCLISARSQGRDYFEGGERGGPFPPKRVWFNGVTVFASSLVVRAQGFLVVVDSGRALMPLP